MAGRSAAAREGERLLRDHGLARRGIGRRRGRHTAGDRRMTSATGVIPTVRDLRLQWRRARRSHSDRSLGELLTDVYLVAFLAVLYGGSAAVSIRRTLT